ncbi:uncharacterized protein F5147DRAFT_784864 [Suillus discolor]|uniref:Uncharacterized protein n=1 Tax=Suillus discolor TaxID=1912936 RepID=A0A9P7JKZ4_9AGAM|nr:uncharacterized protein F5147DRAFT_784864 [Suillus discolor]KAG2079667.1 hypothetical protein F5147DRAFT_784864 [Suillus discolor]
MIQADRRCFIDVGMNSTLSLTKVSTIYPGIHYTDSHASLQPMCLTVCFPGTFPRQILERSDIPVRISVSIDEEYGTFTTPVIEVASLDLRHRSGLLHCSGGSDDSNLSSDMSNVGEPTISFPRSRLHSTMSIEQIGKQSPSEFKNGSPQK